MVAGRTIAIMFAAVSAAAHPAAADCARPTSPEAVRHLSEGKRHYDVREWNEAADEYKAGAKIEASPIFDYDLGQVYWQARDLKAALWHYQRFLRACGEPGERTDSVKKRIGEIQAKLNEDAKLHSSAQSAPASTTLPSSTNTSPPPAIDRPERWYDDKLGWGISGVGLAATGVGIGFLWDASSLRDKASHTPDQQQASSLRNTADSRALIGSLVGIGGVSIFVMGIVKLAIPPTDTKRDTSTRRWQVRVLPNGIVAVGTF